MHLDITPYKEGAKEYSKVSYPIRYGAYGEVRTRTHVFQFNLLGEIKHIQGRREDWPHPGEWLKRTWANDWVYYSSGDYGGIFDRFGEYYFPCPSYLSNSIMGDNPFWYGGVQQAFRSLERLWAEARETDGTRGDAEARRFLRQIASHGPDTLAARSGKLHRLLRGPVTVLPPDSRHADYDVIPLIIADGCLYRCDFCSVKSGAGLAVRSRANVVEQIAGIRSLYGPELVNYNALFLGQHDALCPGPEIIRFAVEEAYSGLGFDHSYMRKPALFFFGSVDSLLSSEEGLFEWLDATPFSTYINIGLESADGATLRILGKPVSPEKAGEAYERILEINRRYNKIEVSANFVMGSHLPSSHADAFFELTSSRPFCGKGSLYLSPIINGTKPARDEERKLLGEFDKLRLGSRLPAYLYLIQRL